MRWIPLAFLVLILCAAPARGAAVSDATETCLECHATAHPGIVAEWKKSRHAQITPAEAMAVEGLGLKVSGKKIPENLRTVAVGCAECHTLRSETHKDTFDHNDYPVHVVVSPRDFNWRGSSQIRML